MAFRILHSSDWHFGQNFYGKSRQKEHQAFINWLLEQVHYHSIDAVIVAGDIFDTGTPPSYAREMYFDFVVKMQALQCPLIILAGNHDSVAMLNESKTLLNKLNCHVIASPALFEDDTSQIIELENADNEYCIICAIPFLRPRDIILSQAGQTAKEKQQQLQQAIAEHYQQLVTQAEQQQKPNTAIITTGHLTTVGASCSDSVRDIYIGTLEAFPASAFPNVDYIALGHIHRAQKVTSSEHIRYCGSPIPLSFDECQQTKTVNIVEFEQGKLSQVTPLTIPTYQVMASLKTDLTSITEDLEQLLANSQLKEGETLWLDIELTSSQYLNDLTKRVEQLVEDYPVEVLLVRRHKKSQSSLQQQDKISLEELSVTEVFEARLAQEQWPSDDDAKRKQRLTQLFSQALAATEHTSDIAPEESKEQHG